MYAPGQTIPIFQQQKNADGSWNYNGFGNVSGSRSGRIVETELHIRF
jgi:hypothetical protein